MFRVIRIPDTTKQAEDLLHPWPTPRSCSLQAIGLALVGISHQLAALIAMADEETQTHAEWMASRQS